MNTYRIVELLGDGISTELSQSIHSLAETLPFNLDFLPVDLSDEAREKNGPVVYDLAETAMRDLGVGLKYPTATTDEVYSRRSPACAWMSALRSAFHCSIVR